MPDLNDIWNAVSELAERDGALPLNKHPGCWYRRIDQRWEIGLNAHKERLPCPFADGPIDIEPFNLFVVFNGWPAGIITPYDGTICAGEAANLETFNDALKAAPGRHVPA
jgi:hypothetical protein